MPFFTVVIPTFNRADKLSAAIRSVLEQSFEDFELLIMDDGSTDHTKDMVNDLRDKRVRYEWGPNSGGPARPRNRGIEVASGQWISFLDADDIWYPTRLAEVANSINSYPESDIFCHNELLHIIGNEKTLLEYGPFQKDFYRVMLTQGNRLSTSAVTVRTDLLLKNNLRFNESRDYVAVEDYDLWLRLAYIGACFTFIANPLGEYIVENDNISLATGMANHNHQVLLRDHVYLIQKFESNKDKLWSRICLRLNLEIGRARFKQGEIIAGLRQVVIAIAAHPFIALKVITEKIGYKLKLGRTAQFE